LAGSDEALASARFGAAAIRRNDPSTAVHPHARNRRERRRNAVRGRADRHSSALPSRASRPSFPALPLHFLAPGTAALYRVVPWSALWMNTGQSWGSRGG